MFHLNYLFTNARSLKSNCKLDELCTYAVDYKLDIIGVVETWLNENVGMEKQV